MKFYLLSPTGVPPNPHLFPMWVDEWRRQGVQIVDQIDDCDVVLFDLHSRIADYKEYDIDYILRNDLPVATFDEWDRGGMSKDWWPYPLTEQQEKLMCYTEDSGVKAVHFSRLLNKTYKHYQENLYPYEKPIIHEEVLLSPDELYHRPMDVCLIANTSPSREAIRKALQADGRLRCLLRVGHTKIPFNDWLNQHRLAKLFVSASGGGYSNERPQHLFSIAGIIQEETDQLTHHQWVHGYDCLKISSPPTQEELDTINAFVNDKELLYSIYLRGYQSMKQHYSASFIANFILEKIKQHLS